MTEDSPEKLELEPTAEKPAAPPTPERSYVGTGEENATRVGLSRRTFFRYQEAGKKHSDPPPFHDPPALVLWYERMKARGVFSHRCPDSIKDAAGQSHRGSKAPASASTSAPGNSDKTPPPPAGTGRMAGAMESSESTALVAKIDWLEGMLELTQNSAEAAFKDKADDEGRRLLVQCGELLDQVTTFRQRLIKIDEAHRRTTQVAYVEEDMSIVVKGFKNNWKPLGKKAFTLTKSTLPRDEFLACWESLFQPFVQNLLESKFAPPLEGPLADAA